MKKNIIKIFCITSMTVLLLTSAVSAATITAQKAQQIALAKTGGGSVTKTRLDRDDGRQVYDIEIINGNKKYTMEIGVNDSKIYDYEEKIIKASSTNAQTQITAEKAKQIALSKASGGYVKSCKLDYEKGVRVWEVEVRNGRWDHDFDINASTGDIVKYEKDYDD